MRNLQHLGAAGRIDAGLLKERAEPAIAQHDVLAVRRDGHAVQRVDGHLGLRGLEQLGQAADMVGMSVADDDPPDVGRADGLAELAVHGLHAGENLPGRTPRPLPVSNSVGGPAPSSKYTRAESVSNTWQGIR